MGAYAGAYVNVPGSIGQPTTTVQGAGGTETEPKACVIFWTWWLGCGGMGNPFLEDCFLSSQKPVFGECMVNGEPKWAVTYDRPTPCNVKHACVEGNGDVITTDFTPTTETP